MKKESFTSFMKQVAADLQQSGNLGTAHVYRSSLNAILVFQESESVEFREITPEWLKHFEGSLRARGCSWNTVSTYLRTMRAVYNRAVDLHRAPYVPHLFRSVYTGTRADLGYGRHEEGVCPSVAVGRHTSRHEGCAGIVYPHVPASGIAFCRSGLPAEERSSGGCHYLPSPQNGSSVVGDVDAGSHVPLAEVYEP